MEAEDFESKQPTKKQNTLPLWGSERTMNMNNMILTNILQSPYFKNELYQLKTYHEVVDEIYYKVDHLEPWEKGSRKTSGQVGMCGGVRGVGAGGIVSTAYCLLYKLFTLRLTRKQLNGLLTHTDSPYIRALGFMYIRYCQPPADLWEWYEPYLEDEEEVDPKAGTGCTMTMGQLVRSFLLKLEWYGTLFPRIPVPIQKDLEKKLKEKNLCDDHKKKADGTWEATQERYLSLGEGEAEGKANSIHQVIDAQTDDLELKTVERTPIGHAEVRRVTLDPKGHAAEAVTIPVGATAVTSHAIRTVTDHVTLNVTDIVILSVTDTVTDVTVETEIANAAVVATVEKAAVEVVTGEEVEAGSEDEMTERGGHVNAVPSDVVVSVKSLEAGIAEGLTVGSSLVFFTTYISLAIENLSLMCGAVTSHD
ncbi:predicted protein [Nematostella vectensis]|uniref:Pre-mRNA-splicing factor 38 n=1 Tax=Nematostella vectensis TaxID=45351 RepID=A7RN21_NEMVE|nr:predicted protein [Nematostella vectensis]|eukprot:XP_001639311.1 predicted protein [Nematostella vectensis]